MHQINACATKRETLVEKKGTTKKTRKKQTKKKENSTYIKQNKKPKTEKEKKREKENFCLSKKRVECISQNVFIQFVSVKKPF